MAYRIPDSSDESIDFGDEAPMCPSGMKDDEDELLLVLRTGNVNVASRCLNNGALLNRVYRSGWNSLMYACYFGVADIVGLLLEHGADAKSQSDTFTALMALCTSQCTDEDQLLLCAKRLISSGAVIDAYDRHQMTPLMYCCQNNKSALANMLIELTADTKCKDIGGWTAFTFAAHNENKTLMNVLLSAESNHERSQVFNGNSRNDEYLKRRNLDCQGYEDLDVFLSGIHLQDLLPMFIERQVTLEILFSMRESDLQQAGVTNMSDRKKITVTLASIQKKEWDMPREYLPQAVLSSSELVTIVLNMKKHTKYLQGTCHAVINSLQYSEQTLDCRKDVRAANDFFNEINDLNTSVQSLKEEVAGLRQKVNNICCTEENCNTPRRYHCIISACCVTAMLCCGFYVWYRQ